MVQSSSKCTRTIWWLGLKFDPMTREELLALIDDHATSCKRLVIGGANLHALYLTLREPCFEHLQTQPETAVIIDGMPVVWMLSALGFNVRREQRITWVDWFELMLEQSARNGHRVFILGHTQEMLDQGFAVARRRWPSLIIGGSNGFFDMSPGSASLDAKITEINAFSPDILVVGMGMPRQEKFVDLVAGRLTAPVIGLGGAAFAYMAGFEPTPPRWMGRAGLEWLHRLGANPSRMANRYLVEPFLLAVLLVRRMIVRGLSSSSSGR